MAQKAQKCNEQELASQNPGILKVILSLLNRYRNGIALLLLILIGSILSPHFLTGDNLLSVGRQASVLALLSLGMTLAMLVGGVDLSVASILGVCGVVSVGLQGQGVSMGIAILVMLVVGVLLGSFNALLITKGRMYPFIATLATMTLYRGFALLYTNGQILRGVSDAYRFFGTGYIWFVPVPVVIMVVVYALAIFFLRSTTFGRNVYAVGGNSEAARLAGINVNRYKGAIFVISGVIAAVAAIIMTARVTVGEPLAGDGLQLDAIAATVIGGTTFAGGIGNAGGTLIGALILGIINNILNLVGVSPYLQYVFRGGIIIVAVLANEFKIRGDN